MNVGVPVLQRLAEAGRRSIYLTPRPAVVLNERVIERERFLVDVLRSSHGMSGAHLNYVSRLIGGLMRTEALRALYDTADSLAGVNPESVVGYVRPGPAFLRRFTTTRVRRDALRAARQLYSTHLLRGRMPCARMPSIEHLAFYGDRQRLAEDAIFGCYEMGSSMGLEIVGATEFSSLEVGIDLVKIVTDDLSLVETRLRVTILSLENYWDELLTGLPGRDKREGFYRR